MHEVRRTHADLAAATERIVRKITDLAATMKVLDEIGDAAIREALEVSAETLDALASFLDALDAADEHARNGAETREAFAELVRELEPPPGPDAGSPTRSADEADDPAGEPGSPLDELTPLRRLSVPYSVLLELERDLYSERLARPFLLRKLKELWGDVSRAGSPHPTEGLVARLGRLAEYADEPTAPGTDVPWSSSDRSTVRDLAERARTIRAWDAEERDRRERRTWVERVEDWVETAEEEEGAAVHMEEMLTRFLTDLPRERTPDVRMLLERILELDDLPDSIRGRTEEILETW